MSAGIPLHDYIEMRYGKGSMTAMQSRIDSMNETGKNLGISFNSDRKIYNTVKAHVLMEYINKEFGSEVGDLLMEQLFISYFENGRDISSDGVMLDCVAAVERISTDGRDRVKAYLEDIGSDSVGKISAIDRMIESDIHTKRSTRIGGVPYFIIENQHNSSHSMKFSGAQPADVLSEVLEKVYKSTT